MYGFGSLIAVGTTLLWLPPFNTTGEFAPFLDALFTATSAATVTGLVTVDTATATYNRPLPLARFYSLPHLR